MIMACHGMRFHEMLKQMRMTLRRRWQISISLVKWSEYFSHFIVLSCTFSSPNIHSLSNTLSCVSSRVLSAVFLPCALLNVSCYSLTLAFILLFYFILFYFSFPHRSDKTTAASGSLLPQSSVSHVGKSLLSGASNSRRCKDIRIGDSWEYT